MLALSSKVLQLITAALGAWFVDKIVDNIFGPVFEPLFEGLRTRMESARYRIKGWFCRNVDDYDEENLAFA